MKNNIHRWFGFYRFFYKRWGSTELILASLMFVAILSLGYGGFGRWIIAARQAGFLQISLHSLVNADYSVDEWLATIPVITLDILRDLLGITGPGSPDPGTRLPGARGAPGAAT